MKDDLFVLLLFFRRKVIKRIVRNKAIFSQTHMLSGISTSDIIYPNPFSTSATIELNQECRLQNTELKIFDLFGREVMSVNLLMRNTKIERGNISSGIYFYKILDEKKILHSGKFVVQ